MNEGRCFPQLVMEDRGTPVLAAVLGGAFEDGHVQTRLLLTESAREICRPWSDLHLRASSRELWGAQAGKHRGRVWIALVEGWWAIRLLEGDDERMARGIIRHVLDCVGRTRAMLESRLAELDPRYRIEPLPPPEPCPSDYYELTPELRFEALLTLRLHIIEATGLDDLDEHTTVLEALHEQAVEATGARRERLRHACTFELAVGRYLGAEATCGTEPRTRAVRRARMHEAFDAACKAFSDFCVLGLGSPPRRLDFELSGGCSR
jgi:hypothetical protein